MWSYQLRNNNPYRNIHKNKLNKGEKKIYAFPDLSPLVRIIKYDVGFFCSRRERQKLFWSGERISFDSYSKHREGNYWWKAWCSYCSQSMGKWYWPVISTTNDSFDTVQTSLLMIKVITGVPMFMPMRLHFIAGSDKVKSSRQKSNGHI